METQPDLFGIPGVPGLGDLISEIPGVGDVVDSIIPKVIVDFFEILLLILESIKDAIFGAIALVFTLAEEGVKMLPLIFELLDILLEFIYLSLEFLQEYTVIPIVIVTLIPFYILMYLLINRLNNLLG